MLRAISTSDPFLIHNELKTNFDNRGSAKITKLVLKDSITFTPGESHPDLILAFFRVEYDKLDSPIYAKSILEYTDNIWKIGQLETQ